MRLRRLSALRWKLESSGDAIIIQFGRENVPNSPFPHFPFPNFSSAQRKPVNWIKAKEKWSITKTFVNDPVDWKLRRNWLGLLLNVLISNIIHLHVFSFSDFHAEFSTLQVTSKMSLHFNAQSRLELKKGDRTFCLCWP